MSLHLLSDLEANRDRFITRAKACGQIWGLRSEDGWAYCSSNDSEADVLLFWSDEAYARRHVVAEWASYVPTPIELDTFIDGWLRGMHEDGVLAGVNFNADLAGLELAPAELALALLADS